MSSLESTAVLFSSGLDSAVLAAAEAQRRKVHPVYVSAGLAWESEELTAVDRLLASPVYRDLAPIVRGTPPGFDTADEEVYLTGRNIVLLTKAGIYCAQQKLSRIAIGPLAGNPFPDATPEFFATMARTLSLGLAHEIAIDAPLVTMHKSDVIRLGAELKVPFELTLSCMNPRQGLHCGQCSKCRERRDAFHEAGIDDPTSYASTPVR